MGVKKMLIAEYGRTHTSRETVDFALKLLGLDEDVWRTTEEGKHFKLDNETGEIKAGFGGKLNGKTVNAFKRGGRPKLTKEQTAKVESLKADFSNRSTEQIQRAYERLKESYNKEKDWVEKYEQLPIGLKKTFSGQYQYHNSQAAPLKAKMVAFEDEIEKRAAESASSHTDFWMSLPQDMQQKYKSGAEVKARFDELKSAEPDTEKSPWKPAVGSVSDYPKEIQLPDDFPEIKVKNDPQDTGTAHAGTSGVIEVNLANYNPENADSILAHEAAHQLTNHDPALQQAVIMNYGNVLGRYNQETGQFDGLFGEGSPEESFATGMAEYINHPDEMKERYPEAYGLFEKIEQENPGAIGYIHGTVNQAKEKIALEQGSMMERANLAQERVFEESSEAKQPRCFETDHEVMKDFNRIEGDHTWKEDLEKVNPGFEDTEGVDKYGRTPRNQNCQNCITAYEARRRGFDVEADVALSSEQTTSGLWREGFGLTENDAIYPGQTPGALLEELTRNPMSAEQARKNTDAELRKMGDGARAVVCVEWKDEFQKVRGTVSGHVFIAENHNGVVRYIDPQSGTVDRTDFFEDAVPHHIAVYRIDDKPLTEKAAARCVKP